MDPRYEVRCERNRYADNWVVFRKKDGRVMTEGSVYTCCRWVRTWGEARA